MKAMSITEYGDPSVIREVELPDPAPGPDEVTIDVTYASVGLIEGLIRRGMFASNDHVVKPPFVPGLEVSGTIRAVGRDVTGLRAGDPVTTLTLPNQGAYAEIARAPAALVVPLEGSGVDPAQAVAGVANAATAYLAFTEVAHLRAGESVLVHGAIGGLASVFPAVARMLGADRVVGTVRSARKAAAAAALGLDDVIVSADLPGSLKPGTVDVIVDPVGGQQRLDSLDLLRPLGRMLVVGNASGDPTNLVDTNQIWTRNIAVLGFSVGTLLGAEPGRGVPAGIAVLPLLADGRLTLPIEQLPLSQAAEAHRRMDTGEVTGRLLLTV
jgi:NADPH2:quinone reductase